MRISDWSSDVCSSDLAAERGVGRVRFGLAIAPFAAPGDRQRDRGDIAVGDEMRRHHGHQHRVAGAERHLLRIAPIFVLPRQVAVTASVIAFMLAAMREPLVARRPDVRSEEHTSELQSLMRISYAVFCLKKKKQQS